MHLQFSSKLISDITFLMGLIVNAALLGLQCWRLYKTKDHYGLSFITFFGFLIIQVLGIINGIYNADFALTIGYGASAVVNLILVLLLVYYRLRFPVEKIRNGR